jgi:hypothetical protein
MEKMTTAVQALKVCKNRSEGKSAGKWVNRPKSQKPQSARMRDRIRKCKKFEFTRIDLVKEAVTKANFARVRALRDGVPTSRLEIRYYLCETCTSPGGVAIWHLTSLPEAEYFEKYQASKGKELLIAAA